MRILTKTAYFKTSLALIAGVCATVALASTVKAEAWFSDLDASDRWEKSQEHCDPNIRHVQRYKWIEKKVLIKREQHIVHTRAAVHGFEYDPYAVKPFDDPFRLRYRRGHKPYNRSYQIRPPKRRVQYIPPVYDVIREKVPITAVGTYCPPLSKFERWHTTVSRAVHRMKARMGERGYARSERVYHTRGVRGYK